jgi:hypothetical protein
MIAAPASCYSEVIQEAGILTTRIRGTKSYTQPRKDDLDRRFPGTDANGRGRDYAITGLRSTRRLSR